MFLAGIAAVAAALLVHPGVGEALTFQSATFGDPCSLRLQTGLPCATCGMTRSWVWAVRGEWARALGYSPAGAALFAALVGVGLLGAARLLTRNPGFARLPWQVLVGATGFWMVVLYEGVWLLRLRGYFPLP